MKIFYPTVEPARASFLCLRVNREEEEAAASARLSTAFKSFLFFPFLLACVSVMKNYSKFRFKGSIPNLFFSPSR